jgi:AcrR family transcriptional regulator
MPPRSPVADSRQQRRARIEKTALELFRARGFDNVTVEDVCAEAGVAPATFYRYFGTKEEVVFSYRAAFATALHASVEAVADLPESARLAAVISGFARFLESQSEMLARRDEIVLGHPRLLQQTLMIQRALEAELAGGLARLRGLPGPDATARLEAGLGILVLRLSIRSWRADGVALSAATQQIMSRLRAIVVGLPSTGLDPADG